MKNEHIHEQGLENASERFKTLRTQEVGRRAGELTLIMGRPSAERKTDIWRYALGGGLFATPGYMRNVEANDQFERDIMELGLRGHRHDCVWVDEMVAASSHKGQKKKKADWKCSAMERHIQKEERHTDPSKLVKWITNRIVITQDNSKGTW